VLEQKLIALLYRCVHIHIHLASIIQASTTEPLAQLVVRHLFVAQFEAEWRFVPHRGLQLDGAWVLEQWDGEGWARCASLERAD